MIERRKHPRTNLHYPVSFEASIAPGRESAQYVGVACDISPKGMLLETGFPIHTATITLSLTIGDGRALVIQGDIVYSIPLDTDTYRTGIVFQDPGKDITELVDSILDADRRNNG